MDKADVVIKSDAVFTGDGLEPFKGGVAVRGDKIVACGDDAHLAPFIGPDTEVRDFGDQLVMPGLIDSHTHFAQGAFMTDPDFAVNLIDCTSFEMAMERVVAFAADHPDNEWILGCQIIQFQWDVPEMPTAAMIDEYISDRPVFLQQVDVHTFSANTCAIEKIGITAETPDPSGGKILRDEAGNPTGVFSNNAGSLFLDEVYNPAPEVASASFAKTAHRANALGITTVGMVNPTFVSMDNPYKFLAELNRKGELPLRVFMYTDLFENEAMTLEEIRAKYDFPGTQVEWHGFKQFIDGVCSDHTAWMLEPYANAPETCGEPAEEPERVRKAILKALEWGVDTRIHAIGDRSVRFILDCFEEGEKRYGLMGCRHSMEHNETVQPEDLPRYAELGVCPAMQPWHMLLDMADLAKDDAVGPERAALSWPIHSLLASGACVHLGSDFPVVGLEPMEEVYGAVYRMLEDGSNPEGWFPEERITMAEALRAYTYGSAYAMHAEDRIGTLACGKQADICVLDRNLFDCEPAEVLEATAALTMIAGKVVFEALRHRLIGRLGASCQPPDIHSALLSQGKGRTMAEEVTAAVEEERELASQPIPGLVRKYTIVTGQGMLAQIIMVVLEGLVMGWGLGAHGLACVSIIMSVEYINLAFGNLFGTGVPAVVGNLLGAGDIKGASKAFSQGFWLTTIVSVLLAVVMAVFTEPICTFFGATPDIMADTVAGVRTFAVLLPLTVIGQMITAVMRVDEKVQIQANLMTVSAIVAICWLALSTFVLKFGVMGAGVYYGLSIGIWAIGIFWFIGGKKSQLQISLADLKLDLAICGQIFKIGFPFFLVQGATFIFNTVANSLLGSLGGDMGSLYIAAFGVINGYILYITMMVAQCFSYGLQPIAAFNAGAKAWARLKETLSCTLKYQVVTLALVTVALWLAATPVCAFFAGSDPALVEVAANATRTVILAVALGYLAMTMSMYFQAVEKVGVATFTGLLRYVICSVPLMYLLGNMMGVEGVWIALVVADAITGIISIALAAHESKRLATL